MRVVRFVSKRQPSEFISFRKNGRRDALTRPVPYWGSRRNFAKTGRDIISLGAGEPDFRYAGTHQGRRPSRPFAAARPSTRPSTAPAELKAAIQRTSSSATTDSTYEPSPRFSCPAAPNTHLFNACMGLLSPGDEAIVPGALLGLLPGHGPGRGSEPVIIETGIDRRLQGHAGKTRCADNHGQDESFLFLNSPSNPTGSCYTAIEELAALGASSRCDIRKVVVARRRHLRTYPLGSLIRFCSIAEGLPRHV